MLELFPKLMQIKHRLIIQRTSSRRFLKRFAYKHPSLTTLHNAQIVKVKQDNVTRIADMVMEKTKDIAALWEVMDIADIVNIIGANIQISTSFGMKIQ